MTDELRAKFEAWFRASTHYGRVNMTDAFDIYQAAHASRDAEVKALTKDAERLNAIAKWCAAGRRVEFAKSLLGNGIEIGLHNPIFATVKENLTVAIDDAVAKDES